MFSSAYHLISRSKFLLSILLLFCLVSIFLMYNHDKHPNFGMYMERCADRAQTQDSNKSSSTELRVKAQPSETRAAAEPAESDTIVLVWKWPFRKKFSLSCDVFNIKGCHLTSNRSLFHKAHGILMHHHDLGLKDMPKDPRPHFQKWVWFNMEPPIKIRRQPTFDNIFNLTCGHRRDSNIPVPYGYLEPATSEDKNFKLPAKDKLVCWIVSFWNPQLKRVIYYNKLKDHMKIDTFGGAFGKYSKYEAYAKIVPTCKFYLSFENSVVRDYITEKIYRPMMLGTVPVVLGPPRRYYENRIPPDSFIHVDDFSSPKELADRLLYLDQNDSEYMKYHSWRSQYKARRSMFGTEQGCLTCKYLQTHKEYQTITNLNEWFFDRTEW